MALSLAFSGPTTAVLSINTPVTLATITTPGLYFAEIDCVNMQSGDTIVVITNSQTSSAGVVHPGPIDTISFAGFPSGGGSTSTKFLSSPYPIWFSGSIQLVQTGGTGRSFNWVIFSL